MIVESFNKIHYFWDRVHAHTNEISFGLELELFSLTNLIFRPVRRSCALERLHVRAPVRGAVGLHVRNPRIGRLRGGTGCRSALGRRTRALTIRCAGVDHALLHRCFWMAGAVRGKVPAPGGVVGHEGVCWYSSANILFPETRLGRGCSSLRLVRRRKSWVVVKGRCPSL